MDTSHLYLAYVPSGVSVGELNEEVRKLWEELESDPEFQKKAKEAGIDLEEVRKKLKDEGTAPAQAITIKQGAGGFAIVPILVFFAPIAQQVLLDLWKEVLLPRIRRRWGSDSLKEIAPEES